MEVAWNSYLEEATIQGITNSPILLSCWNARGETKLGSCSINFFLLTDGPVGLGSDLRYSDYSKVYIFASPEVNQRVYDEMGIKDLISPYDHRNPYRRLRTCAG